MLDIYSVNCTKGKFFKEHYKQPTEEKVKGFIKKLKSGDWYLSHEAVYYGFADSVITHRSYGSIQLKMTELKKINEAWLNIDIDDKNIFNPSSILKTQDDDYHLRLVSNDEAQVFFISL